MLLYCPNLTLLYSSGNGTQNIFVGAKSVEAPGIFIRIIPTATSLFSIPKLNLKRNNVRAFSEGSMLSLFQCVIVFPALRRH